MLVVYLLQPFGGALEGLVEHRDCMGIVLAVIRNAALVQEAEDTAAYPQKIAKNRNHIGKKAIILRHIAFKSGYMIIGMKMI